MIIPYKVKKNISDGFLHLGKATLFLLPIMLWFNYVKKDIIKNLQSVDDIKKFIIDEQRKKVIVNLITIFCLLIIAIKSFFFYKPTDGEISTGLLIDYLKNKKNLIDDNFYKILKNYKPSNISKHIKM